MELMKSSWRAYWRAVQKGSRVAGGGNAEDVWGSIIFHSHCRGRRIRDAKTGGGGLNKRAACGIDGLS